MFLLRCIGGWCDEDREILNRGEVYHLCVVTKVATVSFASWCLSISRENAGLKPNKRSITECQKTLTLLMGLDGRKPVFCKLAFFRFLTGNS